MTRKNLWISIAMLITVGVVAVVLYAYYLGSNMAPARNAQPIVIDLQSRDGEYVLEALNTSNYPITFDVQLRGARPLEDFPLTLWPGERTPIYDLDSTDPDRESLEPMLNFIPGSLEIDRNATYSLPCGCGATCTVVEHEGQPLHNGWARNAIDFDMATGTTVHAIGSGTVIEAFDASSLNCSKPSPTCDRFTNRVVVLGTDGGIVEYLHLDTGGALVHVGDSVRQGQVIARSGNTGNSSGPHLHIDLVKALPDLTQVTVPIRFETVNGPKELEQGRSYRSPDCLGTN